MISNYHTASDYLPADDDDFDPPHVKSQYYSFGQENNKPNAPGNNGKKNKKSKKGRRTNWLMKRNAFPRNRIPPSGDSSVGSASYGGDSTSMAYSVSSQSAGETTNSSFSPLDEIRKTNLLKKQIPTNKQMTNRHVPQQRSSNRSPARGGGSAARYGVAGGSSGKTVASVESDYSTSSSLNFSSTDHEEDDPSGLYYLTNHLESTSNHSNNNTKIQKPTLDRGTSHSSNRSINTEASSINWSTDEESWLEGSKIIKKLEERNDKLLAASIRVPKGNEITKGELSSESQHSVEPEKISRKTKTGNGSGSGGIVSPPPSPTEDYNKRDYVTSKSSSKSRSNGGGGGSPSSVIDSNNEFGQTGRTRSSPSPSPALNTSIDDSASGMYSRASRRSTNSGRRSSRRQISDQQANSGAVRNVLLSLGVNGEAFDNTKNLLKPFLCGIIE